MTERKQARAMDLPDYPHPPHVRDIATHAGSWGWINPGHVAQDDDGYLWLDGAAFPNAAPTTSGYGIAVWTEDGIALHLPKNGYPSMRRITGRVDTARWVPVANVLKEPPACATR